MAVAGRPVLTTQWVFVLTAIGYLVEFCSAKVCPQLHQWQIEKLECPYGRAFAKVTWPDPNKLRETKAKHPNITIVGWDGDDLIQSPIATTLCALYGYVPYAIILINVFAFVLERGTRELSFLLFAGMVVLINEGLLKERFQQVRPEQSCLTSCGMPSGHSTLAAGFLTVMFLENVYRVNTSQEKYLHCKFIANDRRTNAQRMKDAWQALRLQFTVTPLAKGTELSINEFLASVSIWCVILLPVPLSRVAIQDHTPTQVLVGSVFGCVEGVVWAKVLRKLQFKFLGHLGEKYPTHGCFFKSLYVQHNLALPLFLVEYMADKDRGCDDRAIASVALAKWYIKQSDDDDQGFCRRGPVPCIWNWLQRDTESQNTAVAFEQELRELAIMVNSLRTTDLIVNTVDYNVYMATYVILTFAYERRGVFYKDSPRVRYVLTMMSQRLVNEVKDLTLSQRAKFFIEKSYKTTGPCPLRLWLQKPKPPVRYTHAQTESLRAWCEKMCGQACGRPN